MMRAADAQQGFTLLEVIVALAVIAFALAAAVTAVSGNTRNAAGLEQRTYAHWVAMNKLAELQLSDQFPALKTSKGSMLMARHEWFWRMRVTETPNSTLRKVDVDVRADEDDETWLAVLTGYVGKP